MHWKSWPKTKKLIGKRSGSFLNSIQEFEPGRGHELLMKTPWGFGVSLMLLDLPSGAS